MWIDPYNNYHKGEYYWIYSLLIILSMLACMLLTLANIRHLKTREWVALLLYAGIPALSYAIEAAFANLWVTYLGSVLASSLMYVNVQLELKREMREKEAELAETRIATMLSQIQLHFISSFPEL